MILEKNEINILGSRSTIQKSESHAPKAALTSI